MDVLRWRKTWAGLGLALSTTSLAWAAPPEALVQNQGALTGSFVVLTLAFGGLAYAEFKANKGRSFDLEIDRLAAAAAQRQAKKSGDVSGLLDDDEIGNPAQMANRVPEKAPPPPPTAGMPPPPPPPTRAMVPPPPPPPPPPADGDSFGARLAAADELAKPAAKTAPISFGNTPPVPPPPAEGGTGSGGGGGWADLLQRVRSNENDQPNPFKGGGSGSIPSTEDDAGKKTPSGAGGDAWEALLRKTAGAASGEVPPPIPRPGVGLPSSGSFALGNTGGTGSDPEPGRAPSGETEDALPDFIKKSGRTISLDLNKGGAASNPFQKPPQ